MAASQTFEERYGLTVRKATPEEMRQDQKFTEVGFGAVDVQDSSARHKMFRLIRGLTQTQGDD